MATIYGIIVAATNSTMATMEERTQSERTVDITQSERSYTTSYGRSVAATECAMAAMERRMEERSYTTTYGRSVVVTDATMMATEERTRSYHGRN